ncbi:expressed unknown protein [Seminavis robusta]|uniref:Uncharacterized protein n=1 Tax=Seminavis robusta TaxID=568900 RepID=A0A9N8ERB5_9STRA|nr:expressed unknown protein [Seminavis robusta]|eukprot:Sro1394_g268990.1 n/a (91) ;mRNA; r:25827-26099
MKLFNLIISTLAASSAVHAIDSTFSSTSSGLRRTLYSRQTLEDEKVTEPRQDEQTAEEELAEGKFITIRVTNQAYQQPFGAFFACHDTPC